MGGFFVHSNFCFSLTGDFSKITPDLATFTKEKHWKSTSFYTPVFINSFKALLQKLFLKQTYSAFLFCFISDLDMSSKEQSRETIFGALLFTGWMPFLSSNQQCQSTGDDN